MSKRNSVGSSNTLFNYFSKTPPVAKKAKADDGNELPSKMDCSTESDANVKIDNKKRSRQITPSPKAESSSEDEVPIVSKKRKRIRLNPVDYDDSDVENKVDNTLEPSKDTFSMGKKLQDSFKYEPNTSPKSKKTAPSTNGSATPKVEKEEKSYAPPSADDGNWTHCKLSWLKPDKIKDAMKRRPDHPDYDPSTLYVPQQFLKDQTPAHQQWWQMKSSHYDCVLFFKVGKFYELYHMDAAVGVTELGFSYMKGEFAHSGFPESAYGRMASTLIANGYKVARVEQTETPDMMQERCKKLKQTSKADKVVRREICQVTVKGSQVCSLQDPGPSEAGANYMLAIAEEATNNISTYGVCFVDASIGQFRLGQFNDDKHSSRLLTLLAQNPPVLVIYDRKSTTQRTAKLLTTHCHSARREHKLFWTPEKTLKVLAEKYYKTNAEGEWPEGIREFLHEGDALGLTPATNSHLAIKALSGCVIYLTDCLLDIQILGMAQFEAYTPADILNRTLSQEVKVENHWEGGNTMVLDAITLKNLRIVHDEGCLYDKLNFCSTAMGKRLLNQWVCAPSCNLAVIRERQQAVKTLCNDQEICQEVKNILTTLPDLERLLAKVHALGNLKRSKDHPDARAIFYEMRIYSKRNVLDFLSVINGFTAALKLVEFFSETESVLLKRLMSFPGNGRFPDYRDTLKFFKEAFNQTEAAKEGRLLPGEGVDQEYDNTLQLIQEIEDELQQYLKEQEKKFKCRITHVGSDKKRFQLEMPQTVASKVGSDYHMEGCRKGFKRYSTEETKDLLARMIAAEEQKTNVLKDLNRRIFEKFSTDYGKWEGAVQCVAALDVLLSMAEFARQQTCDICLPDVTFEEGQKAIPYISITNGRHPCLSTQDFIPNDTALGGDMGSMLLLTGPNMGGKSTLMRQAGLITVLAHLGSYVPAESCSLSLVDRVFTRLGATDDILSGQSTFLVEMLETSAIINNATVNSLVLLDELGRGTSTYDGTAIASAVCVTLSSLGCRTLFSTHYHSLVKLLSNDTNIEQRHMACMVETDETSVETADEIPEETITFLYKLTPGACPKSYGFNAARLAGIPRDITRRAQHISRKLEKEATCIRAFKNIIKIDSNAADVRAMLAQLSI